MWFSQLSREIGRRQRSWAIVKLSMDSYHWEQMQSIPLLIKILMFSNILFQLLVKSQRYEPWNTHNKENYCIIYINTKYFMSLFIFILVQLLICGQVSLYSLAMAYCVHRAQRIYFYYALMFLCRLNISWFHVSVC